MEPVRRLVLRSFSEGGSLGEGGLIDFVPYEWPRRASRLWRERASRLWREGAVAQLGERLLCKQEVVGSIPIGSTNSDVRRQMSDVGLGSCI